MESGGGVNRLNPFAAPARVDLPSNVIEMDPVRRLAQELTSFLYRKKPQAFNPRWIFVENKDLYKRIKHRLNLKQGRGNWEPLIGLLPQDWQDKWHLMSLDTKKRTFVENIDELQGLLVKHAPTLFGPRWIEKTDESLFRRLVRYRDSNGKVNWEGIVSELEDDWQPRWRQAPPRKKLEDYKPKSVYNNPAEVTEVMDEHNNGLINLLLAENYADKQADEFCRALIRLAQQGNQDALERLTDQVMIVAQEWMDKYEDMIVYKNNTESAQDAINRCIYYFDPNGQTSRFIPYVLKSLRLKAKGMQKQVPKSLDQATGNDGASLYEQIGYDPESGNVSFGRSGQAKSRARPGY